MIFRYPGGKNKQSGVIVGLLADKIKECDTFHDVFIGGGSITMSVAKQYPELKLSVNDLDVYICSFWKLLERNKQNEFDQLYRLIKQKPTVKLFEKLRKTPAANQIERAYYSIFFNRTTFSGIFRSGPIGGFEQDSKWNIDCRYNADKIIKTIESGREIFDGRLKVYNLDFEKYLNDIVADNSLIYLDPPYYVKGKQIYNHFMEHDRHEKLAQILKGKKNWVLSYDDDKNSVIRNLYKWADVDTLECRYSITGEKKNWKNAKELLIIPR